MRTRLISVLEELTTLVKDDQEATTRVNVAILLARDTQKRVRGLTDNIAEYVRLSERYREVSKKHIENYETELNLLRKEVRLLRSANKHLKAMAGEDDVDEQNDKSM